MKPPLPRREGIEGRGTEKGDMAPSPQPSPAKGEGERVNARACIGARYLLSISFFQAKKKSQNRSEVPGGRLRTWVPGGMVSSES